MTSLISSKLWSCPLLSICSFASFRGYWEYPRPSARSQDAVVAFLVPCLEDADIDIRTAAVDALRRATGPAAFFPLSWASLPG